MNEEEQQETMCFYNPEEVSNWSRTICKLKC